MVYGAMYVMTFLEWRKQMWPAGALTIQVELYVMPSVLSHSVQVQIYQPLCISKVNVCFL